MRTVIHVGPEKTGSSAIQKWLFENRESLLKDKIYYPSHSIDRNGISSGNAESLFSRNGNGEFELDAEKYKLLHKEAEKHEASQLVLSSEMFIDYISVLTDFFPTADFVYYLRNPIESAESLYNQSVKRHFNTATINPPEHINFRKLNHLFSTASGKVYIRKYGSHFFQGGDIVVDFLSVIDFSGPLPHKSVHVNQSYTLEALEFKRCLNYFPAVNFHERIDCYLQAYNKGVYDYSLLSEKQFKDAKILAIHKLNQLSESIKVNLSDFIDYIDQSTHRPFHGQKNTTSTIKAIFLDMRDCEPQLLLQILKLLDWQVLPGDVARPFLSAAEMVAVKPVFAQNKLMARLRQVPLRSKAPSQLVGLSQFLENIAIKSKDAKADVLRDMGIMYQKNALHLAASRCLAEAKLYRSHGTKINQLLATQANYLYEKYINL